LSVLKKCHKTLRRYLTIIFVPHTSTKTVRFTFTISFLLFLFILWSGVTIWAGYVTGRHFEYWKVKLDREAIRFKLLFFADQVRKSQELLEQVKERDLQLRALLEMKTKKEIITREADEGRGGPGPKDQLYLEKLLEKKVDELAIHDLRWQSQSVHKETVDRLESISQIQNYISYQSGLYKATPNTWPAEGRITSPFGFRKHPLTGRTEFHSGLDIANEKGTEIHSTADGVVEFTGWTFGYGRLIIINHSFGYQTYYSHAQKILVKEGEKVKRGQLIALMGDSGTTTGVHVHYEVRYKGKSLNPYGFLDRDNFFKRGERYVWKKSRN